MNYKHTLTFALTVAFLCNTTLAQPKKPTAGGNPTEADYYPMVSFDTPKETVMEAGGLEMMPDGKLARMSPTFLRT